MAEFNHVARWWFVYFSTHLVEVSLFILIILVLDNVVIKNTNFRYGLWCLALVKIFVPPLVVWPQTVQESAVQNLAILPLSLTGTAPTLHQHALTWEANLMTIWILSVICLSALLIFNNVKLRLGLGVVKKITLTSIKAEGLELFQSAQVSAPVLLGVFKPRLYLPDTWQRLSGRQLQTLVEHEKAHVENRDLLVLILQYVGVVLFCVNPFVWLMHYRLNTLRELRCDERAIAKSGTNPLRYSKFLIEIANNSRRRFEHTLLVGENFSNKKKTMFTRIYHLLNYEERIMKKNTLSQYVLFALAAMLIVPLSWNCNNDNSQNPVQDTKNVALQKKTSTFDVPPQPVGGFAEIQKHLRYPEIGRKAGIEGRVILNVHLDDQGKVTAIEALKKINDGKAGFEETAINSVRAVTWKPAMLKNKPVAVWVAIPIIFRLNNGKQG